MSNETQEQRITRLRKLAPTDDRKEADCRYVNVKLTKEQMDEVLTLASEEGVAPARLSQMLLVGAIRDYPRKEG